MGVQRKVLNVAYHLSQKTIITVVIIDPGYRGVKGGRINCFDLIGTATHPACAVIITFHVACNEAKPINWSEAVQLKGSERQESQEWQFHVM